MLLDKELQFSDAQAITSAAGSTNTIDLSAANRNIGDGRELYVVVVVTTAFTDTGDNSTLTVALEGDSTTTFTPDKTRDLFTLAALSAVGVTYFAPLYPQGSVDGPESLQYIRLKYTPNNGDLSGGAVDAFLTADISKYRAHAKNYTIS